MGRLVHRLQERDEGHWLLRRGALLQYVGFRNALWLMAGLLLVVLFCVLAALPCTLGKAKSSKSFRELFAKTPAVNLLAAARIFMFGSRDVWFVVGLRSFSTQTAGTTSGSRGSSRPGPSATAAFRRRTVRRPAQFGRPLREVPEARLWGAILTAIPIALAAALAFGSGRPDIVVVIGLAVFGFAFAVISSLHSYLILAYAGSEKAAEDVGFYYAANAAGRLLGIPAVRHPHPVRRSSGLPLGLGGNAGRVPGSDLPPAFGCGLAPHDGPGIHRSLTGASR